MNRFHIRIPTGSNTQYVKMGSFGGNSYVRSPDEAYVIAAKVFTYP